MLPEVIELRELWLNGDQSQADLAEDIGIDRSALTKLLNNPRRRPQPRNMRKIQNFLAKVRRDVRRRRSRSS